MYEQVVKACESCQRFAPAPQRSRVSGMRAPNFGDLWFADHVDISVGQYLYHVLVVVDAASNLIWVAPQKHKGEAETISLLMMAYDDLMAKPKALCADSYFHMEAFKRHYWTHNIQPIPLGPHTPWPNRAEAAVKLFKHYAQILCDSLQRMQEETPGLKKVSVRMICRRAA